MQNIVVEALSNMQRDILTEGELREFDIEKDLQDIDNIFQLALAKLYFLKTKNHFEF